MGGIKSNQIAVLICTLGAKNGKVNRKRLPKVCALCLVLERASEACKRSKLAILSLVPDHLKSQGGLLGDPETRPRFRSLASAHQNLNLLWLSEAEPCRAM